MSIEQEGAREKKNGRRVRSIIPWERRKRKAKMEKTTRREVVVWERDRDNAGSQDIKRIARG